MLRALLTKVFLGGCLAGLLFWDRSLTAERELRRQASTQVEALVPEAQREHIVVAMVTLDEGGGDAGAGHSYEYLRSKGRWRCRQAFGALAAGTDLIQLVDTLLQAKALLQSDVPERAADYGLGTKRSWMVTLHGPQALSDPDGDVLLRIELGDSLAALDGGFVRRPGEHKVWVLDSDPRALLARDPTHPWLPPLLDGRLLPADWPGSGARLSRVLVQRYDGTQYRLELRDRDVSQERQLQGEIPYEWVIVHPDGSELSSSPDHTIAFTVFLRLATWADMLDPGRAEELVIKRLTARLVLEPSAGDPVVLMFGAPDGQGTAPMVNGLSQTLQAIAADVVELLLPDEAALIDPAAPNPWGERLGR